MCGFNYATGNILPPIDNAAIEQTQGHSQVGVTEISHPIPDPVYMLTMVQTHPRNRGVIQGNSLTHGKGKKKQFPNIQPLYFCPCKNDSQQSNHSTPCSAPARETSDQMAACIQLKYVNWAMLLSSRNWDLREFEEMRAWQTC